MNRDKLILHDGTRIRNVHELSQCRGRVCVVHNPTEHHMRAWPVEWNDYDAFFDRECPHGYLHPDPDQRDYWAIIDRQVTHRCDGCCLPPQVLEECKALT